jgi:hypothetical protein
MAVIGGVVRSLGRLLLITPVVSPVIRCKRFLDDGFIICGRVFL